MTYRLTSKDEYKNYLRGEETKSLAEALVAKKPSDLAKVLHDQIVAVVDHPRKAGFLQKELSEIAMRQEHEEIKFQNLVKFAAFYGLIQEEEPKPKPVKKTNKSQ